MTIRTATGIGSIVLVLSGCGREPGPPTAAAPTPRTGPAGFVDRVWKVQSSSAVAPGTVSSFQAPASRSGRLSVAGGQLRFTACGAGGEAHAVEDLDGGEGAALVRELVGGEKAVTAMVRLDCRRLAESRYGAPEGPGCDRLPPEGEVEARGNEPFWMVGVDGPAARLRTPEEQDGIAYRTGRWSRTDGARWIYEAQSEKPDNVERLTLTLTSGRCQDSMSGAHYPFRAVLTRGKDRMQGCALEGRKATPDLEPR